MKNFSLTLAMIALMFTSISQAAYTIDRFPVYDGPDDQTNPDIDGDMIVWQSSDTDIYYKHIDAADPNVIAIGGEQVEPKVSDGVIVWLDKADSDHDVYGYDTINELNLTFTENDTYTQREHDISGNTAVYRDNSAGSYNIYTHPIGATAELVAPVASARYEFDIDGSIVAWVEAVSGVQIMVRDINSTSGDPLYDPLQITSGSNWHRNPAVSGRLIVWDEDSGDGTYDIYGYDLDDSATGVFPICTAAGSQKHPAVSGNIVVWHDVPDEDLEITGTIWAIDLADAAPARFKVSNPADTNANQFPAISGKTIVWQRAGSTDDILGAKLLDPSEVDVTYPNGGESVEAGTSMTITWTSTGPVDNVLIEFSSDGGASWTDVNTIPNTGSYLWDPVADVESTNCLVAVTNVDDPTAYDESDGVFELYRIPNSITVIAPNGGEQFLAGKPMDIAWTSFGPITNVKIEFSDNDGVHWQTVVASTPNDEAFTWAAAPDVNSQACSIRITDADDPAISDISDAALTVFQCDPNLTADLTGDCFVDLADVAELARQWLDCGNPYNLAWCSQ